MKDIFEKTYLWKFPEHNWNLFSRHWTKKDKSLKVKLPKNVNYFFIKVILEFALSPKTLKNNHNIIAI